MTVGTTAATEDRFACDKYAAAQNLAPLLEHPDPAPRRPQPSVLRRGRAGLDPVFDIGRPEQMSPTHAAVPDEEALVPEPTRVRAVGRTIGVWRHGGCSRPREAPRRTAERHALVIASMRRFSTEVRVEGFDRTKRAGPDTCLLTPLHGPFLDTHSERFTQDPCTVQRVRGLDRLGDLDAVGQRAAAALSALDSEVS